MGRLLSGVLLALLVVPWGVAAGEASERRLVTLDGELPLVGDLLHGARVVERFPFAGVLVVEGSPRALDALALAPGVLGVYRDEPITLQMERERAMVGADPVRMDGWPTGAGVTVALVDSGIDASHPAFAGRVAANVHVSRAGVVTSSEGDSDGHGTHVAGIVAGDGARSVDHRQRGVAPGATVVGVDISEAFTTTNAVRGFAWIHDNAERYDIRVVSNSWGREKEDSHYDPNDPVIRASDALVSDGIVVVFSAGNRGREGSGTLTNEAMNPNVITVGAGSGAGRAEPYSSRGPALDGERRPLSWTKPDLVAPGTGVVSTRANAAAMGPTATDEERYYVAMNGTSMAAPHVAAAAALILDEHPDYSPETVLLVLQRSARDLGATGVDDETGHGMLDVEGALRAADLISGGERKIVVERRVPLHMEGSVAALSGQVLLVSNAPRLPPAQVIDLPLATPAGSAGADLWFNWSGQGEFEARLVGPSGSVAFSRAGDRSLVYHGALGSGAWRVEAVPKGVAAYTPYALGGSLVVREEKVVDVPAEMHARSTSVRAAFPADTSASRVVGLLEAAPMLVVAIAGTTAAGVAVGWRMRRAKA